MVEPATFGSGMSATIAAPTGSQRSRGMTHCPCALRANSGRPAAKGSTTAGAEDAGFLGSGGHLPDPRNAFSIAQALVVAKPERLVPHERSADGGAELIALPLWFRCAQRVREKVVRVERVVPQEFVDAAAKPVRPGLDRRVDDRARAAAVLGRIGICLNLEFLERLDRRLHELDVLASEGVRVGDVVHAVQQKDVVERAVAVHVQDALEVDARQARRARQHAGREQGELVVVPPVQRQLDDLLLVDHRPARRRLCVEQGSCPDDFDRFCKLAGAHGEVYARNLRDLQRDTCPDDFRESRRFGGDGVSPGLRLGMI